MNRKRLLVMLLLLLAVALGYAFWGSPRQEMAERSREPSRTGTARGKETPPLQEGEPNRVQLELLQEDEAAFPGFKRNIFSSIVPPPPPPPRPAPAIPPPPPPPTPVTSPGMVPQNLARFTFLGYLERDGKRRVFLSGENELYVVGKGDRFGQNQKYQVVALTATQLVIRQGTDPRDIVVALAEQGPAALESSPFRRGAPAARDFPPPRRTGSLMGSRPVPPEEEPIAEDHPGGDQPAEDQETKGVMTPAPVKAPAPGSAPSAPAPTPSSFGAESPLRSYPSDILSPVVPGTEVR